MKTDIINRVIAILGSEWSEQIMIALGDPQALAQIESQLKSELEAVTTLDGYWDIFDRAPLASEVAEEALVKIAQLLKSELDAATTIAECWNVYGGAPIGTEVAAQAFAKTLSLAVTFGDCMGIYVSASAYEETSEEKKQALAKAISLATIDDWSACFELTLPASEDEFACIRAIAAFLEKEQVPA